MNCLSLGPLSNGFEEREETIKNGETRTKLLKFGTKLILGAAPQHGTRRIVAWTSRSAAGSNSHTRRYLPALYFGLSVHLNVRPFQAPSLPGDAVLPGSSRVNHVSNDDQECSRPVEITQTRSPLFS
jgi:hypothetical protein